MNNPARAHKEAVLAKQIAGVGDLNSLPPYQKLLHLLRQDKQLLKAIKALPDKAVAKREMLPKYQNWLDEVRSSDSPNPTDSVFTTATLWLIDSGQLDTAMPYVLFAIRHQMQVLDEFQRSIVDLFVEEVAGQMAAGQDISAEHINELSAMLTEKQENGLHTLNIYDQVRAKYFKAVGEWHENRDQAAEAATAYELALQYNPKSGVKKRLDALNKQLGN